MSVGVGDSESNSQLAIDPSYPSSKVEVGVVNQVNDGWSISCGRVFQMHLITASEGISDLCCEGTRVAIIPVRTLVLQCHTALPY